MRFSFDTQQASLIHNNKYDYSKVVYRGADVKVEIICPIHGSFMQKGYLHILHKNGCPKCRGKRVSDAKHTPLNVYIKRAQVIHKNRYKYPVLDVKNIFVKIEITCPIHGSFYQTMNNHIHNKNGCPACGYNVSSLETEWINSLNIPHLIKQHVLFVGKRKFKVDAFDSQTNTIYEFFGVFWHGHPKYFQGINPKTKKTFNYHYQKTLEKVLCLEKAGYTVIQKWG